MAGSRSRSASPETVSGLKAVARDQVRLLSGRIEAARGEIDLGVTITLKAAVDALAFDQLIEQAAGGLAERRHHAHGIFEMFLGAGAAEGP